MNWDICWLVAVLCVTLSALFIIFTRRKLSIRKGARCLFVVAHPDDECMFFGPTILQLRSINCKVFVLCASTGDYYGQGALRKNELFASCNALGVRSADVTLLDISDMKDGQPKWHTEKLARIVLQFVEKLGIDVVVTFDEHGVSGHSNHAACFKALQFLYTNGYIPTGTQVFVLESVRLWRKYLGMFDLINSYFTATFLCVGSPWRVWKAMKQHRTQLVWFRYLYMLFSRYVVINTLKRIAVRPLVATMKPKRS